MLAAVTRRQIQPGDVVVIRYEGPLGVPWMREMLGVTAAIVGEGLGESVALECRGDEVRRAPEIWSTVIAVCARMAGLR
jgi:hypothetical protein